MIDRERFERETLVHLQAVQHFALQLCRDKDTSKDLVQETMLKAWRYFGTFAEGTNCKAWLFQICKNSYFNMIQRKQRAPILFDVQSEGQAHRSMTFHPDPRDESAARQHDEILGDEVLRALSSLPMDYRTAVILSDIEGYTYKEIANIFNAPIGTVRARIHRARKMLARQLTEYGRTTGRLAA